MRKSREPTVDDGRWVRQPLASARSSRHHAPPRMNSLYCEFCAVKQYKSKRRRRRNNILGRTTAIAMLAIAVSSIFFLDSSYTSPPVVLAASSHPTWSRSYHSPLYFSEDDHEERILSALAAETESYEDDDDDEMADYSTEILTEDADVDVVVDINDNEYGRRPSVPAIVRSPARGESRRPDRTSTTTSTLLEKEKTLQEIREESLRQKTLQYVSLPEDYLANDNTTASIKKAAEPNTIPADLTTPWVRQFLASCPRDVLLPVPKDYILDNFNLAQLAPVVEKISSLQNNAESLDPSGRTSTSQSQSQHPIYRQALKLILQEEPYDPVTIPDTVQCAAKVLYLLVHQRYVLSPRGLDTVRRRFLLKQQPSQASSVDPIFGQCPRVVCRGMPLLPFGDSDNFQVHGGQDERAKRYCPSCGEGFYHWDSKVDGCAWGTSFCHLFVLTCGDEVFSEWKRLSLRPSSGTVVPRIFGFGLHPSIQNRETF
jgi:hypothetical protein